MTQAFNLSQFANTLNTSGQTSNSGLQNSSVTVTAGTGMSGGGSVALGSSVTLTNAGVTSVVAGSGIAVSGATGAVTVSTTNPAYTGARGQVFTSSGTFTVPSGITNAKITVIGGGGGSSSGSGSTGGNGGTTSFGVFVSATGGTGSTATVGGVGGNGVGGDLNFPAYQFAQYGNGSSGPWGTTDSGGDGQGYGSGAASGGGGAGNGGGGGVAIKWLTTLTPANTVTVTIGNGGTAGSGGGHAGSKGLCIVEWQKIMAGKLTISTLNNDTGVLATQNGMTGIPKAWINFNGNSGGTTRASFNVSSFTRTNTGIYQINFTTAMSDANYVAVAMCNNQQIYCNISSSTAQTTSALTMTMYYTSTATDASVVTVAILGN